MSISMAKGLTEYTWHPPLPTHIAQHSVAVCRLPLSSWYQSTSGTVTLCKWLSGMQVEQSSCSTCIPDGHLQRVTVPDAVLIL